MLRWQRAHLCTENLLEGNSGVRELAEAAQGHISLRYLGLGQQQLKTEIRRRTHAPLGDAHSFYLLIDLL